MGKVIPPNINKNLKNLVKENGLIWFNMVWSIHFGDVKSYEG